MTMTKEARLKQIEFITERSDLFEMEKNVTINYKGKDYYFVIAWIRKRVKDKRSSQALELGITEKTYKQNKEDIEAAIRRGLKKAHIREMRNGWKVRALTGTMLYGIGMDFCTGINYYRLQVRVPKEIWNKIKQWFTYVRSIDEVHFVDGYAHTGWMTSEPSKVEETLKRLAEEQATEEEKEMAQEILKENERMKRKAEEEEKQRKEQKEIVEKVKAIFEKEGERPRPQKGRRLINIEDGEKIENPFYPENIYGGGEWFILQPGKWIWYIRNNGADGDNWAYNNVATGGAGGIGYRLPWNEKIASLLRELKGEKNG